MMLLQCLNVTPLFLLFYFFFSQALQMFAMSITLKGMQVTEIAVVLHAKIIQFLRETGMSNPDAGAGSAKICTTGCQAPQLVTACLKPRQGRRVGEKSSRAK